MRNYNMYKNNVVVTVSVDDRIANENKDVIVLPYGCEYSVLIRNHNDVRIKCSVKVDGKDIGNGRKFIVDAGGSIDIERFLTDNLDKGNALKFIEMTKDIETFRGANGSEGILEVTWEQEKKPDPIRQHVWYSQNTTDSFSLMSSTRSISKGITVPGSENRQQFKQVNDFKTNYLISPCTIKMRLVGEVEGEVVTEVVTAKDKIECSICGKKSKRSASFCSRCGTNLTVY